METPAVANQNPGNLRDPNTGGFQQFADPVEGKAALYNDLTAKMTGNSSTGLTPQSTLVDFAKTYAPASDNNDPLQYAANIANKMGVHPDTPIGTLLPRIDDFASAVMSNEDPSATYQQHAPLDMGANQSQQSQGTGQAPQGSQSAAASNLQSDTSLMGQLNARGKEIGQGADIAIGKDNTENPLSGALQVAGGLAGGVNDITNKALEMSPIVRNVEKSLGSAAQSFFGTPVGQSVLSSIQQFQQDHPEASKDVGAGIDIVSAIPIIKGISAAAGLGLDAASKALQPTAEKSLSSDLASAASKKIAGRQILQSSPEVLDTIVKNPDFLPDVIDGRYNTKDAFDNINSQLENIENTKLQPMLQSTTGGAKPVLDLESVRNDALESAKNSLEGTQGYDAVKQKINSLFDAAANSDKAIPIQGTTQMSLEDANMFKRRARIGVDFDDTPGQDAGYHVGQAYQKAIENSAAQNGLGDVGAVNREMGDLIEARNFLKEVNYAKPKTGLLGSIVKNGVGMVGDRLGGLGGFLVGRGIGGSAVDAVTGGAEGILRRAQKPLAQSLANAASKAPGLIAGAVASKANR